MCHAACGAGDGRLYGSEFYDDNGNVIDLSGPITLVGQMPDDSCSNDPLTIRQVGRAGARLARSRLVGRPVAPCRRLLLTYADRASGVSFTW